MVPINFQVDKSFMPGVLGSSKFEIQRNYFEELKPWLNHHGIPCVDLLKDMKAHPENQYFPKNGEVHFSPSGHEFAAQELLAALQNLGWLEPVNKK